MVRSRHRTDFDITDEQLPWDAPGDETGLDEPRLDDDLDLDEPADFDSDDRDELDDADGYEPDEFDWSSDELDWDDHDEVEQVARSHRGRPTWLVAAVAAALIAVVGVRSLPEKSEPTKQVAAVTPPAAQEPLVTAAATDAGADTAKRARPRQRVAEKPRPRAKKRQPTGRSAKPRTSRPAVTTTMASVPVRPAAAPARPAVASHAAAVDREFGFER